MVTLRSRISLLILILSGACLPTISLADDGVQTPPRTLMRLPGWIESMGDDAADTSPADRGTIPRRGAAIDIAAKAGTKPAADWSHVTPVAAPVAKPTTPAPAAGSTSGFRRWINERVAVLPKPTEPSASTTPAEPTAGQPVAEPQPSVTAPIAVTPDEMPTLSIDPASFRGALPGKTTRQEIETAWGAGEAFTSEDGAAGLAWTIEPFERVEVRLEGEVASSISIKLAEPVPLGDLARQLEIADLRTVAVKDDQDIRIGEVYPERGVIISVEPGTSNATAILIEPLDADSFVLRAEGEIDKCSAYAVADLQYAIQIDPQHVRAQRLLLAMTSDQGKWRQALRLAE